MSDSHHRRNEGLERRVLDALRGLLATRPEDDAHEPSAVESMVRGVAGSVDRWVQAASMSRLFQAVGHDEITAPGHEVELVAAVGPAVRMRASALAFEVDGIRVGTQPIGPEPEVRLLYTPDRPGAFLVTVHALERGGAVVAGSRGEEVGLLHVVADAPVAAVDLAPLLVESTDPLHLARDLVERGWQLCYLGLARPEQLTMARARLRELGLPPGAVLLPPEVGADLRTLGVDFAQVFAAITLRRARSRGVPVVLALSARGSEWSLPEVPVLSPDASRSMAHDQVAHAEVHARSFAREHRAAHDAGDAVGWKIEQMTGAHAVPGNTAKLELDNRRARQRVFELLDGARASVDVQSYILRDGPFMDQFAARLVRRARAGVRVRLLVDGLYGAQDVWVSRNPVVATLGQEPGIEVVARDPLPQAERIDARVLKHRDHRKLLVVDGTVAIVGGRNLGDEYFTGFDEVAVGDWTPSERVPWLDAHMEITGPLVAEVRAAFDRAWQRAGGHASPTSSPSTLLEPTGDCLARLVLHDGLGDSRALGLYEALFEGARERIWLLNDFPVVHSLALSLRRAMARGVDVVMLTGSAVARRGDGTLLRGSLHRELFEHMTKERLEPLLRAGLVAYEVLTPPSPLIVCAGGRVRPYVHGKLVVVDGQHASCGSANLDATASYWEREANVVIHGEAHVGPIEEELRALAARSARIDPGSEGWRREATQRKLAARLWPDTLYS